METSNKESVSSKCKDLTQANTQQGHETAIPCNLMGLLISINVLPPQGAKCLAIHYEDTIGFFSSFFHPPSLEQQSLAIFWHLGVGTKHTFVFVNQLTRELGYTLNIYITSSLPYLIIYLASSHKSLWCYE